ncbi:MAG TPA: dephospho-CoA kinase [Candidatus Dormibacteraeota bacterium]|jgi:dephospho-CoA kinase|nr:dephospho-CoA kinase [Candidatus Dormibacteraeota bacterium]
MRLIGLTGGIGTGKSTVAAMLAERGAALVDADQLAREVVEPGTPALGEIAAEFGPAVIRPDGTLDRGALGAIVFADGARRARLNAITHPRVGALMAERIAAALSGGAPLVVVDIPLLFEGARQDQFEGVLLVWAPPAVQLQRLVERDGWVEEEARQRIAAQMPIDDKRALATWLIDNSGPLVDTARQVDSWWHEHVGAAT